MGKRRGDVRTDACRAERRCPGLCSQHCGFGNARPQRRADCRSRAVAVGGHCSCRYFCACQERRLFAVSSRDLRTPAFDHQGMSTVAAPKHQRALVRILRFAQQRAEDGRICRHAVTHTRRRRRSAGNTRTRADASESLRRCYGYLSGYYRCRFDGGRRLHQLGRILPPTLSGRFA